MAYINTAYLFKCQTCRHFRSDECNTFCENGECYSPNMRMIPTADVAEVKHGEWIKRSFIVFDDVIKEGYHCSVCRTTWDVDTKHCPYCGAKMDGERKEE